jgi:uncharacterized membrane protein YgdD (TMEM256/DUF423 family)
MSWSSIGAALLGLGVALGAFGAHALKGRLDVRAAGIYHTAVLYHFIHALGLLIVSLLPKTGALSQSMAAWICALLLAGIVLFSGSLYALAATGIRALGAVTPVGGVAFISAWGLLAYAFARR